MCGPGGLLRVCRINGLTHINLTKLDVLSDLETIQLGVGYRLNGAPVASVPSEIADLERVEVVYEELPGWRCDISQVGPGLSGTSPSLSRESSLITLQEHMCAAEACMEEQCQWGAGYVPGASCYKITFNQNMYWLYGRCGNGRSFQTTPESTSRG